MMLVKSSDHSFQSWNRSNTTLRVSMRASGELASIGGGGDATGSDTSPATLVVGFS